MLESGVCGDVWAGRRLLRVRGGRTVLRRRWELAFFIRAVIRLRETAQ